MEEHVLNVRLRLIIIKEGELLTEYNSKKGSLGAGECVIELDSK